jgi:hypothetical protein
MDGHGVKETPSKGGPVDLFVPGEGIHWCAAGECEWTTMDGWGMGCGAGHGTCSVARGKKG